ncbi:MAG: VCBS repeat-containing protein, partial [Bacteroidetes bacterium]|nr:VCBS repeat-containing protein [Bacteroidota bacterium]
ENVAYDISSSIAAETELISLSTNPAPVPKLAYRSGSGGAFTKNARHTDDNRFIWLNGISITKVSDNANPNVNLGNDVVLEIKWNDYDVTNHVRWCGNIKLSPHDFEKAFDHVSGVVSAPTINPSLVLKSGSNILIDRGESPTEFQVVSDGLFTEPSTFDCLSNSYFQVESGSDLIVDNNSTLVIQNSAMLEVLGSVHVRNGSTLRIEGEGQLLIQNNGFVFVEDGATFEYRVNALAKGIGANAHLKICGLLKVQAGAVLALQDDGINTPMLTLCGPMFGAFDNTDPIVNDGLESFGASWGDYDGDGDLDVYTAVGIPSGGPETLQNLLYTNNCGEGFIQQTAIPEGIVTDKGTSVNTAWIDIDNDGDLDMFVTNSLGENNDLYLNANGTFTKDLTTTIVQDASQSNGSTWADFDNDGDLDLYVSVDIAGGSQNLLYFNNNDGTFTSTSTTDASVTDVNNSKGTYAVDYDNDGDMDLFVAVVKFDIPTGVTNSLYNNNGSGAFTKVTSGGGDLLLDDIISYSGTWADYNNDGNLDLFVNDVKGSKFSKLYKNDGSGNFTKVDNDLTNEKMNAQGGSAWGDYDNDGDLDVFVSSLQNDFLFRNEFDPTDPMAAVSFTKITDEIVDEATIEANRMVEAAVDPGGKFGADLNLQSAATYLAASILSRVAAAATLGADGPAKSAETWLTLAQSFRDDA